MCIPCYRYERLLRRAKSEDLTEVSGIGCLYQSGVDRLGRPVVVFVGKWFPFNNLNLDKVHYYFIITLSILYTQLTPSKGKNLHRIEYSHPIYFLYDQEYPRALNYVRSSFHIYNCSFKGYPAF